MLYSNSIFAKVEGLFKTKVIKSHVKPHVKSNATKTRESTPYITLTLHFSQHDQEFFCLLQIILHVALSCSLAIRKRRPIWKEPICHLYTSHNTPYLPSKILHNLCFSFLLGITAVPREIENNAYAKFWGGGGGVKVHYGRFASRA